MNEPSLHRREAAWLCVLGGIVVSLAGCGVPTRLHVEDDSRPIVSLRGVYRLTDAPGGPGLEVEASQVHARGQQSLLDFETATVGGQSVSWPATLQHDVRVQHFQLAYNHLLFSGRPIEMEWFAGATWVHTQWNSRSSVPTDPALVTHATWYGPTGGALARVRLAPMLALEARGEGAAKLSSSANSGDRSAVELALALRPVGGVVLRGGYAEYRSSVQPELGGSELSVRARGPFINLGLEF